MFRISWFLRDFVGRTSASEARLMIASYSRFCYVVVLDNARIHHADDFLSLVESAGALVYFLPPYSPDFNPIEEAFSKVECTLS